jgi:diguanylate cyclase (GGDEF)-like protein
MAPEASDFVPPRAASAPSDGPRPARLRLMVAEDEPDTRAALVLALCPTYEILTAADGAEAMAVALASLPDIILLDLMMPKLDGFQVLERLRANPGTNEIPVLVLSARRNEADKVRGLELGAVDYLEKPFSVAELRARVARTVRLLESDRSLRELARTDPLTGLANRRAFQARLDGEIKRSRRYRTPLACVMVDLDQLKAINDGFGHAAGDQAIVTLASFLRDELRETDFVARLGGDEFVALLPHTGAAGARVYAERVCARLKPCMLLVDGPAIALAASYGVASQRPGRHLAGEALLRAADQALYRAKRSGHGAVEASLATVGAAPDAGP